MAPRRHDPHLEDERPGRAFDRRLMGRLLRYALPYRKWMAAVVALILITTALDLVGPFLVKWAIDGPLRAAIAFAPAASPDAPGPPAGAAPEAVAGLLTAVCLYLLATGLFLVLRSIQGRTMSAIGQRVMHDLRMETFTHLQRMPIAYFDRNPVGRLTTRVTNDIEALNQLFTSGVVTFIADVLVLCGISAALLVVDVPLALCTMAALPPLALVTSVFRRAAQRFYREQRGHLAHLNAYTQEALQGMTIIQLFTRERESERRFQEINCRYLTAFQRTVQCYSLYFPAVELIGAGALCLILWRGGAGLLSGTLTFGEFYLFWHFLGRFMSPIRDMAERYNVLQAAMAAAERIFKVLDTMPDPSSALEPPRAAATDPAAAALPPERPAARLRGEVEFRDVWFAYGKGEPGSSYAVRSVSFTVSPGETLAIVGATGAGKSTLVNLLSGFYRPERGSIRVDGRDLSEYPLGELRRRVGVVLQDAFLFSRSVLENIRLGRPGISDEAVAAAAFRTHAQRLIDRLPQGLDTVLGERGAGLSSGEKQLLAFARALVGDPDILVLDEATSFVDAQTEGLIREAQRELLSGRTSIVIAHRLSTIREADRILVIHKGEVRETGTHQELLKRRGIYHRLHRLQLLAAGDPGGPEPAPREGDGGEAAGPTVPGGPAEPFWGEGSEEEADEARSGRP